MIQLAGYNHDGRSVYGGAIVMFNDYDRTESPEKRLWKAVLVTFMRDADEYLKKIRKFDLIMSDPDTKSFEKDIAFARGKSFRMKLRALGSELQHRSFEFMCDHSGYDVDQFRKYARRVLSGEIDLSKL